MPNEEICQARMKVLRSGNRIKPDSMQVDAWYDALTALVE
jgi:hypothetical protein